MQAILAPEVCPSCGSPLEWKNDMLYCESILCPAQIQKRIEHFARSLKIKGLGPKSIEKLGLTSLLDICLLYTSPSPRDATLSRMPSSA